MGEFTEVVCAENALPSYWGKETTIPIADILLNKSVDWASIREMSDKPAQRFWDGIEIIEAENWEKLENGNAGVPTWTQLVTY